MRLLTLREPQVPPNGPPKIPGQTPPEIDPSSYCARRLAGLETGPIPNIGPSTAAAIWALVGAASLFLFLRIYCKIWKSRGIWWDDLVLIVSWTMFLCAAGLSQRVINHGFGKYPCDISPASNLSRITLEGGGFGSAFMILAVVWSKTSFGITILRLTRDKLRVFVLAVVVGMNVAMLLQAVFVWVKCTPVEKNWKPWVEGRCWELRVSNGYGVFSGVLSGVCDVLFALLPWYLVGGLRMKRKEKIGVVVCMSMGVFAGATAFVKSANLLRMGSANFSHHGCYLIMWASAEIATTIMASCIPILRVLFRELRDTTPVEISGTGGRRYYAYPKRQSHSTVDGTKTSKPQQVIHSRPVDTAITTLTDLGENDNDNGNPHHHQQELQPQPTNSPPPPIKPWGSSYWDFSKRNTRTLLRPLASKSGGAASTPATPYSHGENSSQRVLVHVSGESMPGEGAARAEEGGIMRTHEIEVRYEGRGVSRESEMRYEMRSLGSLGSAVGEAR